MLTRGVSIKCFIVWCHHCINKTVPISKFFNKKDTRKLMFHHYLLSNVIISFTQKEAYKLDRSK